MMPELILTGVIALVVGLACGMWLGRRGKDERLRLERADLERERAQLRLESREEFEQLRRAFEQESRDRRAELQRFEDRHEQKEQSLQTRLTDLDRREQGVNERDRDLSSREQELARRQLALDELEQQRQQELARLAGLTRDEARDELRRKVAEDARQEAAALSRQIEEEARREANRRARQIVALAMERCAVEQVSEATVAVVPLAGDEIKGRIIGREGRNIRCFEQLTGVDLVIDDTPEAVVISAFDPIRREVARRALESLVADGRIHPSRIEEVVERCRRELDQTILEAGEEALLEVGVSGVAEPLVELLGKLRYRTSYGQNVLRHSIEVAQLAATMAAELGSDEVTARRAGLLHDIGKAMESDLDAPHAIGGMEFARRQGESEPVAHAIGAHHQEIEPESVEAVLVLIADALSAARPGARREPLEAYIERLERLEQIANGFDGVQNAYAIQAGREVRVIVRPEALDDAAATALARAVADRIQTDLAYPGQIKVTVIREQRAVEFAK